MMTCWDLDLLLNAYNDNSSGAALRRGLAFQEGNSWNEEE